MKKNDGKLFAKWLEENGINITELADNIGLSRQTVYNYTKRIEIDQSFKDKLARGGYDVPLLGVKSFDTLVLVEEPRANVIPVNFTEKSVMYVPLVNKYAYAGYLSGYGDAEYIQSLPAVPMIADREGKGTYMAFEVKGDSMDDGTRHSYEQGDIIIGRQIVQHHWQSKLHISKYDFVIVHRTDGILLKKIIKHDTATGTLTLHSLNPLYDDFSINMNEIAQIFNVIKVEREK
jgi:phage repressor protein C with HTH and peptisase S24 domain